MEAHYSSYFRNRISFGYIAVLAIFIVASILLDSQNAHASELRVETVKVHVSAEGSIPEPVRQRMENSVAAIGDHLLAGMPVQDLEKSRSSQETLIHQVFDKVLVGYSVDTVTIVPGQTSSVSIRLLPWNDTIKGIRLETKVVGMPECVEDLLSEDLSGLKQIFSDTLVGLPLAASDWTNGVLKKRVNSYMKERAPEFRADFDISVGECSEVKVEVYPLLPVVRTIDLSMRSDTIPNAALLSQRRNMQIGADQLIGVPVAFVERHKAYFQDMLSQRIDRISTVKNWRISTKVFIKADENMEVMSRSDSDRYYVRFEGMADVGTHRAAADSLMMRSVIGIRTSRKDGFFALADIYPQHFKWGIDVGYGREIMPMSSMSLRYDIRDMRWKAALERRLSKRLMARYEYRDTDKISEIAIRYKLHDFLSVEYAIDNHDSWMRFIGYF